MEKVTSATQYGDLKGTISLDGYSGSFLHDLKKKINVPEKYFPLGLEVYAGEPGTNHSYLSMTLYAADTTLVGNNADAIKAFAASKGNIEVESFEVKLPIGEILPLIKRCSVVVCDRLLANKIPMMKKF